MHVIIKQRRIMCNSITWCTDLCNIPFYSNPAFVEPRDQISKPVPDRRTHVVAFCQSTVAAITEIGGQNEERPFSVWQAVRAVRERRIRGTVGGREGEKRKKQLIWVFNHHESLMKKASLIAVNQRPPGIKASTATNVTDSRTKTFTNEKKVTE